MDKRKIPQEDGTTEQDINTSTQTLTNTSQ